MTTSKLFKILGICTGVCTLLVFLLYAIAEKPNSRKNGFSRKSIRKAVLERAIDLKYPGYYFAGISGQTIYLGHPTAPLHLLQLNLLTGDTIYRQIHLNQADTFVTGYSKIFIDSPNIVLQEGITPSIFTGNTSNWTVYRQGKNMQRMYYDYFVNLDLKSFVGRTLVPDLHKSILFKADLGLKEVKVQKDLLESQGDGIFSTDGTIAFDPDRKLISYTYYYRNQFIVLDSNLTVLRKVNTIDTNSFAKLSTAQVSNSSKIIRSTPSYVVNKYTCGFRGDLYIQSGLKADNEDTRIFKGYVIIDIYSLTNYMYSSSIYLPKYKHKEVASFKVAQNKILAITDQYLCLYNFH